MILEIYKDSSPTQNNEVEDNSKLIAVGKTYKVGPRIEDLNTKRISLLKTANEWKPIGFDELKKVGINQSNIYSITKNKYFSSNSPYGTSIRVGEVSLNKNITFNSNSSYFTNSFSTFPNAVNAQYRFYGEGQVSQNTGFSLWKRVVSNGINAQVLTNAENTTKTLGGQLWLTSTTTKTRQMSFEGSTSVTAGGKIGVPFVAEGEASATVTIGASVSLGKTKSFSENFYFPEITVPAGKSVRYVLEERYVPVVTNWKFPVQFRGNAAATIEYSKPGYSGPFNEKKLLQMNAFNVDYDQPSKYHKLKVEEYLSHEFRVAVYKVDW